MHVLFAEVAAQAAPSWSPLVMMGGILVIFYFIVMRPQLKQRREHEQTIQSVTKNDEVVTMGGLHGTVSQVKETTLVLRLDDAVKVEIDRAAISRVKGR
jgi:preprotein translocase subunit YajC